MKRPGHWYRCITHEDSDVSEFVQSYFRLPDRSCLFIGGAGFDPRSAAIAKLIAEVMNGVARHRLRALFIRERRPNPDPDLVRRGDEHAVLLRSLIANSEVADIEVLSQEDRAVVCGRRAVDLLRTNPIASLEGVTDVVLDMSALSIGVSFPLARFLLDECERRGDQVNFHLFVASHSQLDASISSVPNDTVDTVRGFGGDMELADSADHAKIWLPHLAMKRNATLNRIRDKLSGPVDICPVLPISERDPKAADKLIAEFKSELNQEWEIDPRNLIYALEDDPLDLYRTISTIYRRHKSVFDRVPDIESHMVLSPSGNKVLAIGALMASLNYDLPVRYVEAVSYLVDWDNIEKIGPDRSRFVHVWLHGQPYAEIQATVAPGAANSSAPAPSERAQ